MAYTTDDLFGSDRLLGDVNDLDNLVEFGDDRNNSDVERHGGETGDGADEDDNDGDKVKKDSDHNADKKKVIVKRPQPKLNADRLKGPRGLKELKKSFTDIKFYGKGHEARDLQQILARLEHWSHRLFPKLQFDDFLGKCEKLGSKRPVKTYITRLRMGLEDEDDNPVTTLEEENVDNPDVPANETMGEFDRLLAEQVTLHENSRLSTQTPTSPRTPGILPRAHTTTSTPVPSLTPEQRARIEANRLAAMEKRRTRAAVRASGQQLDAPPEQSTSARSPTPPTSSPGCLRDRRASVSAPKDDASDDILEAVAAAEAAEAGAGAGELAAEVAVQELPDVAGGGSPLAAAPAVPVPDVIPAAAADVVPDVVPASAAVPGSFVELPVDIADVELSPLGVSSQGGDAVQADTLAILASSLTEGGGRGKPAVTRKNVGAESRFGTVDLCLSESSSSSSGDTSVTTNLAVGGKKRPSEAEVDNGESSGKRKTGGEGQARASWADLDPPSPGETDSETLSWNLASFMSSEPQQQRPAVGDLREPDDDDLEVVEIVGKGNPSEGK